MREREMRNLYNILGGRPRRIWEDNIRMDLKWSRMEMCGLDESGWGKGPVVGSYKQGNEPSGENFLTGW